MRLRAQVEETRSLLELLLGTLYLFSHRPRALEIDTPFVNAATEGTEFLVSVGADQTRIIVFEGRILAQNPDGELLLASGDAAVAAAGEAPRAQIVAQPRDAVAWTLYYPPILVALAEREPASRGLPPGLQTAVDRVAANDYPGALRTLDTVPDAARDARYYTYRAGVLLNVGRVDEARDAIGRALAIDPAAGEALAQRAIIALVQDRRDEALADARRAVELSPDSPAVRIALSYAQQANFQLEAARATLREAVQIAPEDALAWARLSEIELSFGELRAAPEAANRAVALAPALSRTQTVLGFADLARFDVGEAKSAFERAIALDSADPLPRLGLGLAMIRQSDLEQGRNEIEIAVALDPDNSLLRSYLGKAFFEEKRDRQAGEQYAIAKRLDPFDPTPWLYDAIRLQTENRPVEALRDLNRSIALNDNRAVFRSSLLLDEDLATRQVSLARIYDDLGFEQVGLLEATKSLSLNPGNSSAHRFLSDTYLGQPRLDIARASELLQAQLLQPININPVQPSLPITDINIVAGGGPGDPAFNELTPLFERNQLQLNASGVVGTQDTYGDEVIGSGLWNRYSFSAGQFHYQTEGFRANNDFRADIYNVFGQVAVTPDVSLLSEYRHRDTEQGDLEFLFDPDEFFPTDRLDIRSDTVHVGGRYAPRTDLDILAHVGYVDRQERLKVDDPADFVGKQTEDSHGFQAETQMIYDQASSNLIAGAGFYRVDVDVNSTGDFVAFEEFAPQLNFKREQLSVYVYESFELLTDVQITLGASYDDFQQGQLEVERVNPKLGLMWQATPRLRLRAAYFETIKRALAVDQTIEPTQVSAFNQFFDDDNGTKTRNVGVGLDYQLTNNLYAGFEFFQRELDRPRVDPITTVATDFEKADERLYRGYLYWTPSSRWALSAEAVFDTFHRDAQGQGFAPDRLHTLSFPLGVRYFDPSGFFAEVVTRFTRQNVDRVDDPDTPEGTVGDDTFVLVDAMVGYRLPRRLGIVSLEGSNLLNEHFRFQDDNFRTSEIRASSLWPERMVLARLTLNF